MRGWSSGMRAQRDAEDRIFYNPTAGTLQFDADGNTPGGVAAVTFAILTGSPDDVDHTDFLIV